ncbi:SH3 domain-containing protein [Candidatus Peribacteria bacterium]|nr:MAG: SH3 domain-containing protein [Candidatus Peribacteria bacterium]
MARSYSSSRSRSRTPAPFIAFLLVASFGILFAGCNGPEDVGEDQDFVFTQENIDEAHDLAQQAASGALTGTGASPYLEGVDSGSGATDTAVLDLSMVSTYNSIRAGQGTVGKNVYRVTNEFLNVRDKTSTTAANVARLVYGDSVEVLSFPNAGWAEVKTAAGQTGFVSIRYIAKMTSDEKLAEEKKAFEGQYFVSYGFVNMRKEANQSSEKLGEIPGQTIVKPNSINGAWANVTYDGKVGYVAMSYLSPFTPNFIVRQNQYTLPVLHYQLTKGQETEILKSLTDHVAALKAAGKTFTTFAKFHDQLVEQQRRDIRLDDKNVIVAVTGITPDNVRALSDALIAANIDATFFIQTRYIGLSGITQKTLLNLMANGFDVQPNTHTGDDLRALTNAQVELELKQSRKIIEDLTNKDVVAVAYPQGGSNDRVMELASQAGYLMGLGTGSDKVFTRDQLLNIPGIDIFPNMTAEEVVTLATTK